MSAPLKPNPVDSVAPAPGTQTACRPQFLCMVLLAVILLGVAASLRFYSMVNDAAPHHEAAGGPASQAGRIEERLDPNAATWAELARLPRIGEATARRIVAYRESHRSNNGGEIATPGVFTCPEDLTAVEGIGPKTLIRIADYLKFPADDH